MTKNLYNIYISKYKNIANAKPFCFLSTSSSSNEAIKELIKEGYNKEELEKCANKHKFITGDTLWNYTGD